jgi:hypothetical protein
MAIKDTANRAYNVAGQAYDQSLKVSKGIYAASEPYRSTGKSIIAAAKGNLFEFPVFISSSVQLDYATATSSLLEQIYASYLQSALSLNPIVDESLVRNKTPFAKFQSDTNRYVEYTDMDYAHDAVHNEVVMENGDSLEFDMMNIEDRDGKVIVEYYNKRPLSEFDHYFQEQDAKDYEIERLTKKLENASKHIKDLKDDLSDANSRKDYFSKTAASASARADREAKRADAAEQRGIDAATLANYENQLNDYKKEIDDAKEALKESKNRANEMESLRKLKKEIDDADKEYNLAVDKFNYQKSKDTRDEARADKRDKLESDKFEHTKERERQTDEIRERERAEDWNRDLKFKYSIKAPEMLDESKIKKLNTMKPLMMNVQFHVQDKTGALSEAINYVVAVKTYNRIIDADTLPDVAEYPLKEMNKIARKAKWRAGELKFFRDIVFKVKQKKQTAVDSRDPKRKWYRRLYELAHMTGDAPTKAAIKGKNITWSLVKSQIEDDFDFGVIPNSTLVISSNDVVNVKAKTGIDLLNGHTATKLCKELFLIAMVVIDTDAESIKILLPDNHDDYEVHSLASVNKQLAELSTAGSKTRDIFKLLG